MTDPEPAGYVPLPGTPLVSQADCWHRQCETLRVLADILDAHPDLPAITWTVSWLGGVTGEVFGLGVPPEQARATFTAWQQALRLENVKETPIRDTGIVSLSGRTYWGTVRVGLTARAYYPLPDDDAPSQEPAATDAQQAAAAPGRPAHPARANREPAGSPRGSAPVTRPDRLQTGPLIRPRPAEGPQPTTQTLRGEQ
jgi:hypothetical protein